MIPVMPKKGLRALGQGNGNALNVRVKCGDVGHARP